MKLNKLTLLVVAIVAFILPTSCCKSGGWVKVEGNRFIDPQGNEIVFRGLCFSDPV